MAQMYCEVRDRHSRVIFEGNWKDSQSAHNEEQGLKRQYPSSAGYRVAVRGN